MDSIYYFYILTCNDGTRYYGHTNNLRQRLIKHTKGQVYCTKNKQPQLVYYEEFASRSEAYKREMQFKNGKTRKESIEKLISSFSKAKCQGFNSQTPLTQSVKGYDLRRPLDSVNHLLIEGGKAKWALTMKKIFLII